MSVVPVSSPVAADDVPAQVDVVLPVHDEARQLAASVATVRAFLDESFPLRARILIVDNASTDGTWAIANRLAHTVADVDAVHLDRKGRGFALRAAWSRSRAPVVAYMDVDLATGLGALLPLVAPLLSGHSDIAVGTRLAPGAHVVRGARRELLSRGYNLLVRTVLRSTCSDAQCGFKAMRREVAAQLLPLVEDNEWFFDTELLVVAQRMGLRIHEVPVDWVDDLDSRVDVIRTAWKDVCGVSRLVRSSSRWRLTAMGQTRHPGTALTPGAERSLVGVEELAGSATVDDGAVTPVANQAFADELLRFAGVGVVSTVAYLALVSVLQTGLGIYAANALAVVVCSVGNTAVHRRMTRTAGGRMVTRHLATVGAALMAVSLGVTTATLAVTRAVGLTDLGLELVALTAANLAAAVVRFGILRTWVFRPRFGTSIGTPLDPGLPGDERGDETEAGDADVTGPHLPRASGS